MDTGCGYNLITKDVVAEAAELDEVLRTTYDAVKLNTAGGPVQTDETVGVSCPEFDEGSFDALLLQSTPPVISVGERCMNYGYSFHWPAWSEAPYLETRDGHVIRLTVENRVPYLYMQDIEDALPAPETDDESEKDQAVDIQGVGLR